jgi:hypothetical protein
MADSGFWRDLAERFRALEDPYGMLRADWACVVGSGEPGQWRLPGGAGRTVTTQFESLAKRGASALSDAASPDLLIAWLEALRCTSRNFGFGPYYIEQNADGSEGPHRQTGTISRLCEASANYCSEPEGAALEAEFQEKHQSDQDGEPSIPAGAPAGSIVTPSDGREAFSKPVELQPAERSLINRGQVWSMSFGNKTILLQPLKGILYLSYLLREPGREFDVLDLIAAAEGRADKLVDQYTDEVLDRKAIFEFNGRAEAAARELEEARAQRNLGRIEQLEEEVERYTKQITKAKGFGGRLRRFGDDKERARKAVSKVIRGAIGKIRQDHPVLGKHLQSRVTCGNTLCYTGDTIPWLAS